MRGIAAGLLVLGLVALGGCQGTPSAEPTTPPPTPTTTPLSAYSTPIRAPVSRSLFCDRVSPTAIEHAIGGPAEESTKWVNGDPTPTGDRGREYGCSWSATGSSGGGHASAWVFAPPITRARATALAKMSPGMKCERSKSALEFGDPRSSYVCRLNTGAQVTQLAGLFGDAWLTCQAPSEAVDEFCGAILAAASSAVG
jgi:hypothetical protein